MSNKEPLLPLSTDLGVENCYVDTSHLLYIRVEAEQGIFLFENVALYRMAVKFIKCFTDEVSSVI